MSLTTSSDVLSQRLVSLLMSDEWMVCIRKSCSEWRKPFKLNYNSFVAHSIALAFALLTARQFPFDEERALPHTTVSHNMRFRSDQRIQELCNRRRCLRIKKYNNKGQGRSDVRRHHETINRSQSIFNCAGHGLNTARTSRDAHTRRQLKRKESLGDFAHTHTLTTSPIFHIVISSLSSLSSVEIW